MSDEQLRTPIVLIIFNRPDTTEKVFAEIAKAKPARLFVIADGPRTDQPNEAKQCMAARQIIEQVNWECGVLQNYSEINLGCKQRISTGLDWVFENVEEAIILEDDCVPHPTFFPFCEKLLEKYRYDKRVMMITGSNFLLNKPELEESYFFSRFYSVWGWATWRRAWRKYDHGMNDWGTLKNQGQLKSFYAQDYMQTYTSSVFDQAYENTSDSWATHWFYTCLFNSGLCVVSGVNLISNIGGWGAHSEGASHHNFLPTFPLDVDNIKHPDLVFANYLYDHEFYERSFKRMVSHKRMIIRKLFRVVIPSPLIVFIRRVRDWSLR